LENKFLELGKGIEIKKIKASGWEEIQDIIPAEILLTIVINNRRVSTISCSPGNEIELSVGYLVSSGYVKEYSKINTISLCEDEEDFYENDKIFSKRNRGSEFKLNKKIIASCDIDDESLVKLSKTRFITSGCGSIDDFILENELKNVSSNIKFNSRVILKLNLETSSYQKYKKEFGGLHSAAIFDRDGKLISIMEDLGRHNCIDKVIGCMLINGMEFSDKIIYTTGRLTIDIIYKVCAMSIPIVVTNSSITYSAAMLAKKVNITAVGYARGGRFNIYSCPWRILY